MIPYEPKEFTVWWEATIKMPDDDTAHAMRQIALFGWFEGHKQGYSEASKEKSK